MVRFPVEGEAPAPKESDKACATQSMFSPAMWNKTGFEQPPGCLLQHRSPHLHKVFPLTLHHLICPILTQVTAQNLDFTQTNRSLHFIIFLLHTHCFYLLLEKTCTRFKTASVGMQQTCSPLVNADIYQNFLVPQ